MTLIDNLLFKAEAFWLSDQPLPMDLFYRLISAGVDVEQAEKEFDRIKAAL